MLNITIYSCRKATTVQLSRPVVLADGTATTAIPVLKNQNVIVGVAQANRDTDIWGQDADEWKPDRWFSQIGEDEKAPFATQNTTYTEANGYDSDLKTRIPRGAAQAKLPGVYSGM